VADLSPVIAVTLSESIGFLDSFFSVMLLSTAGDKSATKQVEVEDRDNVIDLRRLAGL